MRMNQFVESCVKLTAISEVCNACSHFLLCPLGSPLSVVLVSAADSAFSRMQFVDFSPVSANDFQAFTTAKVRLLVVCKSGAIHTVTTGRGTQSCTKQVAERLPEFYMFLMYASFVPDEKHAYIRHYTLYNTLFLTFPIGQNTAGLSQLSLHQCRFCRAW